MSEISEYSPDRGPGVEDLVDSIVSSLRNADWQPLPPGNEAPVAFSSLVALLASRESIDNHRVLWDADKWKDGISKTFPESEWMTSRLSNVIRVCGSDTEIRRRDLFDLRDSPPIDFYFGVMAWGFGPTAYGWWRTAEIARTAGPELLSTAVEGLRDNPRNDPGAAWDAWTSPARSKLKGVGTAFASKLAYFGAFDRRTGRGPLIADANTAWGAWALTGLWDSRKECSKYVEYVNTADDWAKVLGCRPDEVERALFRLGPEVRVAWKRRGKPQFVPDD
jgi:hypothetical protein